MSRILSMGAANAALLFASFAAAGMAASQGTLQVDAAKVDITPAERLGLAMGGYANRADGFDAIHDHIYTRAIVLNDGTHRAALVTVEVVGVPTPIWEELSKRIAAEAHIPAEYLIVAAVHDHSAPILAGGYGRTPDEKTIAYAKHVQDLAVQAVSQAEASLQPAPVGVGTGEAYINVNRRELMQDVGWWLGHNSEGPSDKTLAVMKFVSMSGKPIAFLINYPVHAVVMGSENFQITGDLGGATSRFVEQRYSGRDEDKPRSDTGKSLLVRPEEVAGDSVVALWTSGAAGDQNPTAMARKSDFTLVNAFGQILGEEVVRVANKIQTTPDARIWATQKVITCPGRNVEPGQRPRKEYKFDDADPVNIRLSLMMINDIALAGVSGEVLTPIYWHLKKATPFTNTIMITHANGGSGDVPNDAAFDQVSYEITTSHLKPGCAENAIVNGLGEMMSKY